jgi:tRNA1(Val) A37 N6-methylase TrmN6
MLTLWGIAWENRKTILKNKHFIFLYKYKMPYEIKPYKTGYKVYGEDKKLSGGAGAVELSKEIKNITLEEAKEDYEKLVNIKCKLINPKSNIGNRAMDYFFFKHRLNTKTESGKDFVSFYNNKEYLKSPSSTRLYKFGLDNGKNKTSSAYDVFRLYQGSINAFKPLIARQLYCKYMPKSILDFSAGWGGRCLGAMSLNINYTGFDTNKELKTAYEQMIKTYPHDSQAKVIFMDSSKVDYSKYDYDFVFTSPPYFKKTKPTEQYENMPVYETRDEFNEKFFFPVVRNTYKHLKSNGVYALNIPIDMYKDIKKVLGGADKKYLLTIQSRYADKEPVYKEYIYIWNKTSKGGAKPKDTIINQLEEIGLSPKKYLQVAREQAEENGYKNFDELEFSDNGIHKLQIPNEEGKIIRFGRVGYGDFLIWSYLEGKGEAPEGQAEKKRNVFRKSHLALSEKRNITDPYAPNNLAINILWG